MRQTFLAASLLIGATGAVYAQGVMTTVAGTDWVFSGDGKPALNVPLGNVSGIAVDPADGNPVFADGGNCMVGKINLVTGILSVIAGNGFCIGTGDGGPATSAGLHNPLAVAFDKQGNLYIGGDDIRKVSKDGTISTVTTSVVGVSSIAMDDLGNLYVAEAAQRLVLLIPANLACGPLCQSLEASNPGPPPVHIAGFGPGLPPPTAIPYPCSQGGLAYLLSPSGVALDAAGNLYIANGQQVVELYGTPQPNGFPVGWSFCPSPSGNSVAFDNTGTVMYTGGSLGVTKLANGVSTVLAGPTNFGKQIYVAPDNLGNVYVADFGNSQIKKISASGVVTTLAGNGMYRYYGGEQIPAGQAILNTPGALALGADQSLYFSDANANRVYHVDSQSGNLTTVTSAPSPIGLAFDPGGILHIGVASGPPPPAGNLSYVLANRLTSDSAGDLYDTNRGPYAPTGTPRCVSGAPNVSLVSSVSGFTIAGEGAFCSNGPAGDAFLNSAAGLTVDLNGNLLVANSGSNQILRISAPPHY